MSEKTRQEMTHRLTCIVVSDICEMIATAVMSLAD